VILVVPASILLQFASFTFTVGFGLMTAVGLLTLNALTNFFRGCGKPENIGILVAAALYIPVVWGIVTEHRVIYILFLHPVLTLGAAAAMTMLYDRRLRSLGLEEGWRSSRQKVDSLVARTREQEALEPDPLLSIGSVGPQ